MRARFLFMWWVIWHHGNNAIFSRWKMHNRTVCCLRSVIYLFLPADYKSKQEPDIKGKALDFPLGDGKLKIGKEPPDHWKKPSRSKLDVDASFSYEQNNGSSPGVQSRVTVKVMCCYRHGALFPIANQLKVSKLLLAWRE